MTPPSAKLAGSLDLLRALQERGVVAVRAADLARSHRERLVRHGFLLPVMKGWYIAGSPDWSAGDSTAWYAAFWPFCAGYLFLDRHPGRAPRHLHGGARVGERRRGHRPVHRLPGRAGGAVAQVPFVDVLTTMLDDSIPLTTGEYDEWGNLRERAAFDDIPAYSPYDNVAARDYPALLVLAGLHDSQLQYWEPAKWVAKLRA